MFGVHAIYEGAQIVLATRQKEDQPIDNGIWIGTKLAHHEILKKRFPSLQNLEIYKIKSWLLLPEGAEDFEETAQEIATLIKQNSDLIGNIPTKRKRKKRN